jgi:predicted GIY-YIG superfamily endonuclease
MKRIIFSVLAIRLRSRLMSLRLPVMRVRKRMGKKVENIIVSGGVCGTPDRIRLDWRHTMNTLSPHATNGNPYTVYALIDPRSQDVCYIGITKDIYRRFIEHIRCTGANPAKDEWILSLRSEQVMVIVCSLERVQSYDEAMVLICSMPKNSQRVREKQRKPRPTVRSFFSMMGRI